MKYENDIIICDCHVKFSSMNNYIPGTGETWLRGLPKLCDNNHLCSHSSFKNNTNKGDDELAEGVKSSYPGSLSLMFKCFDA